MTVGRRIRIAAAMLAAIVLVALVGAILYLRSSAFQQRLERLVAAQLEQATGTRVELQGFRLQWSPLQISLDGLALHGREPAGQAPLAAIPHVTAQLSWRALWHRRLTLDALTLVAPRFHVFLLPDGGTNLPAPRVPAAAGGGGAGFQVSIGHLRLTAGSLQLEDRTVPLTLDVADLGAEVAPAGAAYTGAVQFTLPQWRLTSQLRFRLARQQLDLSAVELSAPGAQLAASGQVRDFTAPRLELQYRLNSRIEQLPRAWLPLQLAGTVAASGSLQASAAVWTTSATAQFHDLDAPRGWGRWNGETALTASPAGLVVDRLQAEGMGGRIAMTGGAPHWRHFALHGHIADIRLRALQPAWPGLGVGRPWRDAIATLDARLAGTLQVETEPLAAAGDFTLTPDLNGRGLPVTGATRWQWNPAELRLASFQGAVADTHVHVSGAARPTALQLQYEIASSDAAQLRPLLLPLIQAVHPGPVPDFGGQAQVSGTLRGPLDTPTVTARLQLEHARIAREAADILNADLTLSPGALNLTRADYQLGVERIHGHGTLGLVAYAASADSALDFQATMSGLPLARVQSWAGVNYPVNGRLSATGSLSGSWAHPTVSGSLQVVAAHWRNQAIEAITAGFRLDHQVLASSNLQIALAHTRITGTFQLDLRHHDYQIRVASNAVQLADVALLQSPRLPVRGSLRFQMDGSGHWDQPHGSLVLTTANLTGAGESLGDVAARLDLDNGQVAFQVADVLTNGSFHVTGTTGMAAPYPLTAQVALRDYDFDAWLRRFTPAELSGHSRISGTASIQGPLAQPDVLHAEIALDPVELAISGLRIHNQGPVSLQADGHALTLAPAHIIAQDTDFTVHGAASLGPTFDSPLTLSGALQGNINLALIHALYPPVRTTGELQVSASLAGTAAHPQMQGEVHIVNAALTEENSPIGFDAINGALRLQDNRLQIDQLTAHTGSGTLDITGYAAKVPGAVDYDLRALGQNLRLRYQGISAAGDMQLRLSGHGEQGLIAGNAQLNRIGLDRNFDLALFIANTQAPAAPPNPDSLLNQIRLNVHLTTGPQVEVDTNQARLSLTADVTLRGTLANPTVLGRASASDGQVLFGGNQFEVSKAQVQFINPTRIEPLLDVSLRTTVQQYDVTLNLAGPADKLAITYRSDPPLSSADVVALLATGQPTQATASLTAASNYSQSEALLGEALNNLVAGRLQRLFGITQVQVNPNSGPLSTTGSGGTVTVVQQVSRNLKLTYTQNLVSSAQDVIQVDWTISRFLGITLSRDQFGLYGLQFTFRHRAR